MPDPIVHPFALHMRFGHTVFPELLTDRSDLRRMDCGITDPMPPLFDYRRSEQIRVSVPVVSLERLLLLVRHCSHEQ